MRTQPRCSSARAVAARKGCASRNAVRGPTGGRSAARDGGRKRTGPMPSASNRRRNWPSTMSASTPTTRSEGLGRHRLELQRLGGGRRLELQRLGGRRRLGRQLRHQRLETAVLALGEGGLDAAAGIVEHAHRRREAARQPGGGAGQVELDHLRRARADQEQQADVGAAGQQPVDHAIELVVRVGAPGEVALLDDRGGKARLGEDHDAGCRLQQMRAGARADDEEEGVLDPAVQPDDAGQSAEHLALALLAQDRMRGGCQRVHFAAPPSGRCCNATSSQARRSLSTNWVAFTP